LKEPESRIRLGGYGHVREGLVTGKFCGRQVNALYRDTQGVESAGDGQSEQGGNHGQKKTERNIITEKGKAERSTLWGK